MNGGQTAPPFDPSKPFTTSDAPPAFDPSKPFTAAPSASASGPPSSIEGNIGTGVVTPLVNMMVGDPIRGAAADVMGLIRAGLPTDPASQDKFWTAREQSLRESQWMQLPENQFGKRVIRAPVEALSGLIGKGVHAVSEGILGSGTTSAIAPYAQIAADAAPFAGVAKIARPLSESLGARAATNAATADKPFSDILAEKKTDAALNWIDRAYNRAVGPSTTGHDTPLQRRQAISEIVANKPELQYTDAGGKIAGKGRAPESLGDFLQAIYQSKDKVRESYQGMERTADASGAKIDMAPTVQALRQMASNESLLRTSPEAAREAAMIADRYEKIGTLSPSAASEDVKHLNDKLDGYYQNRPATADAEEVAARTLRQSLYQTLGPEYQQLRHRFGSLRAIQNDVQRASRRVANWRAGGGILGPVGNVVATEEMLRGAFTGNMGALAAGMGVKGSIEYMKHLRSPNTLVKKIFERAEKHLERPTSPPSAPPVMQSGLQPRRPTGMSGIPGQQRPGTPRPPGGTSVVAPPRKPLPIMPPQRPRTDFEDLMGGGNPLF